MASATDENGDAKRPGDTGQKAVDEGRTGDKIPVRDPAAASDHTDAEAGGPGTPRVASAAVTQAQMSHRAPEEVPFDPTNPGRGQAQIPERGMAQLIGVGFAFLILLGLLGAIVTRP